MRHGLGGWLQWLQCRALPYLQEAWKTATRGGAGGGGPGPGWGWARTASGTSSRLMRSSSVCGRRSTRTSTRRGWTRRVQLQQSWTADGLCTGCPADTPPLLACPRSPAARSRRRRRRGWRRRSRVPPPPTPTSGRSAAKGTRGRMGTRRPSTRAWRGRGRGGTGTGTRTHTHTRGGARRSRTRGAPGRRRGCGGRGVGRPPGPARAPLPRARRSGAAPRAPRSAPCPCAWRPCSGRPFPRATARGRTSPCTAVRARGRGRPSRRGRGGAGARTCQTEWRGRGCVLARAGPCMFGPMAPRELSPLPHPRRSPRGAWPTAAHPRPPPPSPPPTPPWLRPSAPAWCRPACHLPPAPARRPTTRTAEGSPCRAGARGRDLQKGRPASPWAWWAWRGRGQRQRRRRGWAPCGARCRWPCTLGPWLGQRGSRCSWCRCPGSTCWWRACRGTRRGPCRGRCVGVAGVGDGLSLLHGSLGPALMGTAALAPAGVGQPAGGAGHGAGGARGGACAGVLARAARSGPCDGHASTSAGPCPGSSAGPGAGAGAGTRHDACPGGACDGPLPGPGSPGGAGAGTGAGAGAAARGPRCPRCPRGPGAGGAPGDVPGPRAVPGHIHGRARHQAGVARAGVDGVEGHGRPGGAPASEPPYHAPPLRPIPVTQLPPSSALPPRRARPRRRARPSAASSTPRLPSSRPLGPPRRPRDRGRPRRRWGQSAPPRPSPCRWVRHARPHLTAHASCWGCDIRVPCCPHVT